MSDYIKKFMDDIKRECRKKYNIAEGVKSRKKIIWIGQSRYIPIMSEPELVDYPTMEYVDAASAFTIKAITEDDADLYYSIDQRERRTDDREEKDCW